MILSPMRFKNFVWPHNPRTYTITYERNIAVHKIPFGRYAMQDVGLTRRVMSGEGEFFGPKAYDTFKELASTFYEGGPGVLIHPVWQAANVYFVELALAQEPRRDYVRYTFTFWESYDGYQPYARRVEEAGGESPGEDREKGGGSGEKWHTVAKGETLWGIARSNGVELTAVIALNPQLRNLNLIRLGERVRLR